MATSANTLDTQELESRVKEMYREVAEHPEREFHFETGRALAERLGYPPAELDEVPAEAIDSFAGVGYYFDLADLRSGETVVDLGSGSGMDSFLAARKVGRRRPGDRDRHDRRAARQGDRARRPRRVRERRVPQGLHRGSCPSRTHPSTSSSRTASSTSRPTRRPSSPKPRACCAPAAGSRSPTSSASTQLPEGVTCDASLWAACIGGAMQRDDYRQAIEDAGFTVESVRENEQYRFISERADNATQKYGVKSISLLALKRT